MTGAMSMQDRIRTIAVPIVALSGFLSFAETPQGPGSEDLFSGLVEAVVESPGDGADAPVIVYDGILGVLDAIGTAVENDAGMPGEMPLGTLDFVAGIYESNDFYETGYWGKDGTTYNSLVYTGSLPSYCDRDFVPPVKGRMTSPFGYREAYHRMHKGIDIALQTGDEVMAALPGVVGRIGYEKGGYGHFVIVVHSEGVETRYAHLSKVTATLGSRVEAGETIALGGSSGNSTGPHLHFEVRRNGRAIDPLAAFDF